MVTHAASRPAIAAAAAAPADRLGGLSAIALGATGLFEVVYAVLIAIGVIVAGVLA